MPLAKRMSRQRAVDVLPVGAEDPERVVALKKHEEGITKSQDKRKAKDTELPVAVKPVGLVPMPSGEHNEVSYAPRKVKVADSKELTEHIARLKQEPPSAMRDRLIKTAELAIKESIPRDEAARKLARATDALATLPLQTSGSEPKDHMLRANQYEIQGDRARALDSYRAAATGYRRANDRANEAKARDGVAACQSVFAAQYDHPGAGRVKVCDSAESAMRTAVERTRAGESVRITDGKVVRPGRSLGSDEDTPEVKRLEKELATSTDPKERREIREELKAAKFKQGKAKDDTDGPPPVDDPSDPEDPSPVPTNDEHEGFKKLEGKLSKEKGVTDPAALAASIGRKKYGEKGMEAKSVAARDADSLEIQIDKLVEAIAKSANKSDANSYGEKEFRARMEQERQRLTRNLSKARDAKEVQPV